MIARLGYLRDKYVLGRFIFVCVVISGAMISGEWPRRNGQDANGKFWGMKCVKRLLAGTGCKRFLRIAESISIIGTGLEKVLKVAVYCSDNRI